MSAPPANVPPPAQQTRYRRPVSFTAFLAFLLLVLTFVMTAFPMSLPPIAEDLHNFNYFHVHLPAMLLHYLFVIAVLGPFPASLLLAIIARRRIQSSGDDVRGAAFANIVLLPNILWLLPLICVLLLFAPLFQRGQDTSGPTHRGHAQGFIRLCDRYADENAGQYPPDLAYFVDNWGPQMILLPREHFTGPRSSRTPYTGHSLDSHGNWLPRAADLDAHSDIFYLGGDLTKGPQLAAQPNIILMYAKYDIAPKTWVVYNPSKFRYDLLPRRIVAFANGTVISVCTPDLPALFAAHNAARATLGLPPQTLDIQPPVPTTAPTRPAAP